MICCLADSLPAYDKNKSPRHIDQCQHTSGLPACRLPRRLVLTVSCLHACLPATLPFCLRVCVCHGLAARLS